MKKLMMIGALLAVTAGAHAQDRERKSPQERAHQRTERMTKDLGLNADQAARVEAINLKYAEQAEAMRSQHETARETMREKGKAMHQAQEAELEQVLSPEQMKQWKAQQEKMRARHMEKRKEMREKHQGDEQP